MDKYQKATEVSLGVRNKGKFPIWKHKGKFYIKVIKSNPFTEAYKTITVKGKKYSQVKLINKHWHLL